MSAGSLYEAGAAYVRERPEMGPQAQLFTANPHYPMITYRVLVLNACQAVQLYEYPTFSMAGGEARRMWFGHFKERREQHGEPWAVELWKWYQEPHMRFRPEDPRGQWQFIEGYGTNGD